TPRTCSATPVPYGPPGRTVSRVLPVAALVPGELVEVQVGRDEPAVTADAGVDARGQAGEPGREAGDRCAAGRPWHTAGHAGRAAAARAGPAALLALALALRRLGGLAAAGAGQPHHPAHLAHLPHHRLGLGEAVEQLVHLDDGVARAGGDPRPAGTVDDLRSGAFLRGHGPDDRRDLVQVPVVDLGELVLHLAHARHHRQHVGDRAHPADHEQLLEEVVQGEVLAGEQLGGHPLLLLLLQSGLRLLDEGQHVAHAEDAAGQAVGVEDVEVAELLAG